MAVLDRYLARELARLLPPILVLLTLAFLVSQLLRLQSMLFGAGVDGGAAGRIVLYVLPSFLSLTLPVALLLAIVATFSTLAQDNELLVLSAAGASPLRLLPVPLALAFACTVATAGATLYGEAWGARGFKSGLLELTKKNLIGAVRAGAFTTSIPGLAVYVSRVDGPGRWRGVFLEDSGALGGRSIYVARGAEVRFDGEDTRLVVSLEAGSVHPVAPPAPGAYRTAAFDHADLVLDVSGWVAHSTRYFHAYQTLDAPALARLAADPATDPTLRARVLMFLHRKLAFPLSCLLFCLVGAALAQNRDPSRRALVWLASVAVVAVYYGLYRAGEGLAGSTPLPPELFAWLPNATVAIVAGVLWRRALAGPAR